MKRKIVWLVASCLIVATLLLASCAPAVEEEEVVVEEEEAAPVAVQEEAAPLEEEEAATPPEEEVVTEEKEDIAPVPTPAPVSTIVLEIDGNPPPAIETIQYGQSYGGIELLSRNYDFEVIIPPSKTITAPFDSDVLPDGQIVMAGNSGMLVSVNLEGGITETAYPANGANFESDDSGAMWYYSFWSGMLSYWKTGMPGPRQAATLPAVYTDGSIAVSPDGTAVYIGWWQSDYDINSHKSAIYRYSEGKGLEKLVEGTSLSDLISAVEVTPKGNVFIARNDGIYKLTSANQLEQVYSLRDMQVRSDGMTSDDNDNLYFSAYGMPQGIHKLTPEGTLETIVTIGNAKEVPFGLSWDRQHQLIIGVRKERGEIVSIDMKGTVTVLNSPSGLTTPIPVEEHPSGTIFVNGDEAGLLMIDGNGTVHSYCKDFLVSYQPPAADFCFDSNGLIYYSFAAPGFDNMIVTVDKYGRVSKVTEDVGAPAGIEVGADGVVYYADYQRSAVYALTDQGDSICIADGIPHPVGLVIDSENNFWVGATKQGIQCDPLSVDNECFNTRILRFRRGETPEEVFTFGNLRGQREIYFFDVDEEGNLYIPAGNRLLLRAPDGKIAEIAEGFNCIRAARVARDGRIYITDYGAGALYRLVELSE